MNTSPDFLHGTFYFKLSAHFLSIFTGVYLNLTKNLRLLTLTLIIMPPWASLYINTINNYFNKNTNMYNEKYFNTSMKHYNRLNISCDSSQYPVFMLPLLILSCL